jgi:Fe2+ or Zn2+ uptake regulation protein
MDHSITSEAVLPKAPMSELTERLRRRSRKITGPRQAILEHLRHQHHPVTNKEIHSALRTAKTDLATVYRCMHLLEEMGMVKAFDFGDGVVRYELLRKGDDGHHHHLVCTKCSAVRVVEGCFPVAWEEEIAARAGYRQVTHRLEFFGLCPGCQSNAESKRPDAQFSLGRGSFEKI